ncbi:MAG: hypothetical protein Q8907_13620, partial [Bacteroidota bacterium]|nr:hypothetical protein [Bacteroidota bacterium]
IINVANDISRISKNNSTEASTPEVNNSNCALFQHRYELQRGFARNAYNSLNKKKKMIRFMENLEITLLQLQNRN